MEIIFKDIAKIRLTLVPDRETIKFPNGTDEETVKRYLGYVEEIKQKVDRNRNLRGKFLEVKKKVIISMKMDDKKKSTLYAFRFDYLDQPEK
jgi:hypothetical protein